MILTWNDQCKYNKVDATILSADRVCALSSCMIVQQNYSTMIICGIALYKCWLLMTPRWPLTLFLLGLHVCPYPKILLSKCHKNPSKYVRKMSNSDRLNIFSTWYIHIHLHNDHFIVPSFLTGPIISIHCCQQYVRRGGWLCGWSPCKFWKIV